MQNIQSIFKEIDKMIKFSIIVPIYKVEEYLHQCLDSILCQDFKNFELILVDDGSPDNCPKICDEYAVEDKRIKVIHKENGGLSDARNSGIKIAKGEYIIFVDSDDYWDGTSALANIACKLDGVKADVLIFGSKNYYYGKNKCLISKTGYDNNILEHCSMSEILKYLFDNELFPGAAWRVAVRRDLIVSNNIFFIKGIKGEDYDWLLNLFYHARVFTSINDTLYIYRKGRIGSITQTADIGNIAGLVITIKKWHDIIINSNFEGKDQYLSYLGYIFTTTFSAGCRLKGCERKMFIGMVKQYKHIHRYADDKKSKSIIFLYNILGVNITLRLLRLYFKAR